MDKYFTFAQVLDGEIKNVLQKHSDEEPDGEGWELVPNDFTGCPGEKIDRFDSVTKRRYTDAELVDQGKMIDKRGRWYNKETREEKIIRELDEDVDEDEFTRAAPIEGESYQLFDGSQWIVDEEKKEIAEAETELFQVKSQVKELEDNALKKFMNLQLGIDTEENEQYLEEYKSEIVSLRSQVTSLEAELQLRKSA